ncbi:hypothetical protein [Andreprevotia chitinilytica]|uniref:hypothetical protein n=1 Tax=Andreprevotia chitinilytica TaxID=396808 RepID=UPI000555E9E2|nr:hypothetical protein [Andreprevotia chitinilytica]
MFKLGHIAASLCFLAAPAFAFDFDSVMDSVNKAVDTVKHVGSVGSSSDSSSGGSGSSGGSNSGSGANSPNKIKTARSSPIDGLADAQLSESDHRYKEMDEYTVLLSRPALNNDGSIRVANSKVVRGQVFHDLYEHPDRQSTLQVWEGYKQQLKDNGYKFEFVCAKPCTTDANIWYKVSELIVYNKSDSYVVASKGNTYVAITVGEISGHPRSSVDVVQTAAN